MFKIVGIIFVGVSCCLSSVYGTSNQTNVEKNSDQLLNTNNGTLNNVIEKVNFTRDYPQKESIVNIRNRSLSGLTYNKDTWQLSAYTVAHFNNSYQPTFNYLSNDVKPEFKSSLSWNKIERLINGIKNSSLFVEDVRPPKPNKTIFQDIRTFLEKMFGGKGEVQIVNSFARLSRGRKEVQIDPLNLMTSQSFAGNISQIVRNKNISTLQRAKKLVHTLNKYGWYMPIHYVLGNAVSEINLSKIEYDQTNFTHLSKQLMDDLMKSYKQIIDLHDDNIDNINKGQNRDREPETNNIKESTEKTNRTKNIEKFIADFDNEKNWQIVEYIKFYPTLTLLKTEYNWEFSECAKLLRDHFYLNALKELQNQFDMEKYSDELARELSPKSF